jgi:hypothetical protein
VHSSLLRSCRLRASAQQHGCSGKVLGRPSEEWRDVSVGVGVRAFVGASVVVACQLTHQQRRCTAVRLIGCRTVFAPVVVPLPGLLLHRNVLCRPPVAGLCVYAQLLT